MPRKRVGKLMVPWIAFGQWSQAFGSVFARERWYGAPFGFSWTPIVFVSRRYPWRSFYRGVWPKPVKVSDA